MHLLTVFPSCQIAHDWRGLKSRGFEIAVFIYTDSAASAIKSWFMNGHIPGVKSYIVTALTDTSVL